MPGESFGSGGGGVSGGGFGNVGSYYNLGRYVANLFSHPSQVFITNPFQGFEDAFIEGKAKTIDTTQAVLRLGESSNPVVRQFGRDLGLLEQGGVVLSTSGGIGRANLNKIFAKAAEGLEAQGFSKQQAARELINVISSHTAASGAAIRFPQPSQPSSFPSTARPNPSLPLVPRTPAMQNYFDNSTGAQAFANQISPMRPSGPLEAVKDFVRNDIFHQDLFNDLTGLNVDIFRQPPDLRQELLKGPIGQPQNPLYPMPPIQPGDVPTVDPSKCKGCTPQQRQMERQLENQRGDLQREIQIERQQQGDKQLGDQQRQIQHLHDLESQPVDQRDIQHELEQKAQLLSQIEQELEDLQFRANNPQMSGYSPTRTTSPDQSENQPVVSQSGEVPTISRQRTLGRGEMDELEHETQLDQIFMQGQPAGEMPDPSKAVKFCVACASQNDAYMFLNGEPSACSVVAS